MISHLFIAFLLLIVTTVVLSRIYALPKNIWVLFLLQPLVMAASPVIVFIGGILASQIAPDPSLATLPVTVMILGVASAAVPAAMLAKKWGRKKATYFGFLLGLTGCLIAALATIDGHFILFTLAALLLGMCTAFIQQLRFAGIESAAAPSDIPKVLSVLMLSGIFSAFLGPEIAVVAKDWISSAHGYTGSFLLLAALNLAAMAMMTQFKDPTPSTADENSSGRPLSTIAKQPLFFVAITTAALGFALMSYLMTATPLSMHNMDGHSLNDTKWVIQTHIAAMFLPSLFTGFLVSKYGLKSLFISGVVIYGIVAVVAFSGHEVMHYWWALLLLGVGWNFLFLTGTSLLPQTYENNERHQVQALNDFVIFASQASASLLAGWVLFSYGWQAVVLSSLPFIVILVIAIIVYLKHCNKTVI